MNRKIIFINLQSFVKGKVFPVFINKVPRLEDVEEIYRIVGEKSPKLPHFSKHLIHNDMIKNQVNVSFTFNVVTETALDTRFLSRVFRMLCVLQNSHTFLLVDEIILNC
jgi:hypothetical protein